MNDATYQWRVRAEDDSGRTSGFTATRIFTVDTKPPTAPVLNPVLDDSGTVDITNDAAVTFSWQASTSGDVDQYRLQVTSGDTFNPHFVLDKLIIDPTTSFTTTPLTGDGLYRWRVGALDDATPPNETAAADLVVRTFILDTQIDAPVLVAPGPNAIIGTQTPTFSWTHDDASAVTFTLRVTTPVGIPIPDFPGITAKSFTLPTPLGVDQQTQKRDYTWQVTAIDAAGNVRASVSRDFTVDLNAPQPIKIISPKNETTNPSITVLSWTGDDLADVYDVEVAFGTGDFTASIVFSAVVTRVGARTGVQSVTVDVGKLAAATHYRWHVRGRTTSGLIGPFSTADFITAGPPAINVQLEVTLQGTGPVVGTVDFKVRLFSVNALNPGIVATPWRLFENQPVYTFTGGAITIISTSGDRTFTIEVTGVAPGFYDITVEANHTLANLRDNVPVHVAMGRVKMGTLLEGNAIDDPNTEPSSIINALDLSLLAAALNEGKTGDLRLDFNRDGVVTQADLDLICGPAASGVCVNYLEFSPILVDDQGLRVL